MTFHQSCAEVIRVILKDQGAEFDEKVVTMEMWMEGTLKASCVSNPLFGIFEDGDLTLYQTNAIRRHFAQKLDLLSRLRPGAPTDPPPSPHPLCLDAFPSLQSYLKRLCARPNLHIYLQSDDFKNRPIIPGKRA
ncbi:unnamed protein product [Coregonus sp. 'balchen']|nr:unnamed protein product [Coregonus sp. 'balchen']